MKPQKSVRITQERLGGYTVEVYPDNVGVAPDRGCRTSLQDALVLAAELIEEEETP